MWETIELRELRTFLTLAEELHFGRTAARLHVSSSRVSQTLQSLERQLGGQLLHRTSRRVTLTPLGERFVRDVAVALESLDDVLRQTQASSALTGTLRLHHFSPLTAGPHLSDIVAEFRRRHPRCDVELGLFDLTDMLAALLTGEVDLISSWLPLEDPRIEVGPILVSAPRVLAVAGDHALAGRDEVSVEELAGYRVPLFEPLPADLRDAWIPSHTPSGRPIPRVPVEVRDRGQIDLVGRIRRGEVVHPTVPAATGYLGPGLRFVPLTGLPPMRAALIWRRDTTDPNVRAFAAVAREVLDAVAQPPAGQPDVA